MVTDWEDFEFKFDQALGEVMLTDEWRDAPTLTIVLKGMLEVEASLPLRVKAKPLLALLETPLADMTDVQRSSLSDELLSLWRFVCHRGEVKDV